MGIRSDVGLACKVNLANEIESRFPWVRKAADQTQRASYEEDETTLLYKAVDMLYHFVDIKWYPEHEGDVKDLCDWLKAQDPNDYLLIEACPEYPESGVYMGEWLDNPWNMRKVTRVEVEFDGKME